MSATDAVQRALVTGAAHGIGAAIMGRLASEGFAVARAVPQAAEALGGLDTLVTNAGIVRDAGGITALVKTAARKPARGGTTVNTMRPGSVDPDMTRAMPDAARDTRIGVIPLARAAQPANVAWPVAFVCSDDAAFMTGAVLDVNGGFYM